MTTNIEAREALQRFIGQAKTGSASCPTCGKPADINLKGDLIMAGCAPCDWSIEVTSRKPDKGKRK